MDTHTLTQYLDHGAHIVTATERLARELKIRYAIERRRAGDTAWDVPPVISLHRWAEELWLAGWPSEQVVEPAQEMAVYRRIIQGSGEAAAMLAPQAMARMAQQAATLVESYQLDPTQPRFTEEAESAAFAKWYRLVQSRKLKGAWLSREQILDQAARVIDSGKVPLPPRVVFVGFLALTPQQQSFTATLQVAGVEVTVHEVEGQAGMLAFARHASPEAEVEAVAKALRDTLTPFADCPQDAPSIAVVVPDVDKHRSLIEVVFRRWLAPNTVHPSESEAPRAWRYSKGTPLADHELAASALMLLEMGTSLDIEQITALLLNRRFGLPAERAGRARIDVQVRRWGARRVPVKAIIKLAVENGLAHDFGERLQLLQEHMTAGNDAMPSEWARRFRERLQIMGWPGASLSSEAYQAKEAFEGRLAQLSTMDRIAGSLRSHEALTLLRELTDAHPFLAREGYRAPVEIIGLWDIAGHRYDAAYVLSLSAAELPAKASPNPLLPYEVQREAGMPNCSPESEMDRALALVSHLNVLAPTIYVSCPLNSVQGHPITPSLMVGSWPQGGESAPVDATMRPAPDLEDLAGEFPPIAEEEKDTLRGGTAILAAFARAPFFAQAEARLHLKPLDVPTDGISARVQGNIRHAAMQRIWAQLRNSETLAATDDKALMDLIDQSVSEAMEDPEVVPPYTIGPRLAGLERQLAVRIIRRWMAIERRRTEPFEVIAMEQRVTCRVGGLEVPVIIDRIDRITTGHGPKYLMADYKSGITADEKGWDIENLVEPQLPIYASTVDLSELGIDQVDGIAFYRLTDTKVGYVLCTNWTAALMGEETKDTPVYNWEAQLQAWRNRLTENVEGFLAGDGSIDFATYRKHRFQEPLFGLLRPLEHDRAELVSE